MSTKKFTVEEILSLKDKLKLEYPILNTTDTNNTVPFLFNVRELLCTLFSKEVFSYDTRNSIGVFYCDKSLYNLVETSSNNVLYVSSITRSTIPYITISEELSNNISHTLLIDTLCNFRTEFIDSLKRIVQKKERHPEREEKYNKEIISSFNNLIKSYKTFISEYNLIKSSIKSLLVDKYILTHSRTQLYVTSKDNSSLLFTIDSVNTYTHEQITILSSNVQEQLKNLQKSLTLMKKEFNSIKNTKESLNSLDTLHSLNHKLNNILPFVERYYN